MLHHRRSRALVAGAAALAVAVIGGVTGAPPAAAAPASPSPATAATAPGASAPAPALYPRPQSIRERGPAVAVTPSVALLAGPEVDDAGLDTLRTALRSAGAREVTTLTDSRAPLPATGLLVYAGGPGARRVLAALDAPGTARLPAGGYVLAAGRAAVDGRDREVVALAGADSDGAFHAAQTLRRLAGDGAVPGVAVRDWPVAPVRGVVEGFYGEPWTHRQRLAMLDFLGSTKQNRYLYAPGADPYRQVRWREPYPKARAAELRALADRARRNHVTLAWAVSPGQSFCFSSRDDLRALIAKLDAMWSLGVRAYQLQFQDVSYEEWHCGADRDAHGTGPKAAARAQADLANAVAAWLTGKDRGAAAPLSVLPTEFYQDGSTEYRTALADALDGDVQVAWSGVGVVPRTITGAELAAARDAFTHPLVTMDNYPVNDYAEDRVFLGPYTGRSPAVAAASAQLLANAMRQPAASRIALFTVADFAWNPRAYRPAQSWDAALRDLAGGDVRAEGALRALAANSSSSPLDGRESARLAELIDGFWTAHERTGAAGAAPLRAAFDGMAEAPGHLARLPLAGELRPWTDQLGRYGEAGRAAVDMLTAQRRGDGERAWREQLRVLRLREELAGGGAAVGEGVLDPFLDRALAAADDWTGVGGGASTGRGAPRDAGAASGGRAADGDAATSRRAPRDGLTVRLDGAARQGGAARPLDRLTVLADPAAGSGAAVRAHVPGEGWRPLGRLGSGGWTELSARGVRADRVRVVPSPGSPAPVVHEVVPWYADTPAAEVSLERREVDVAAGSRATVPVRVTATRPGTAVADLAAPAPEGLEVTAPAPATLRRGATVTTPLTVTVPRSAAPGAHTVPVRLTVDGEVITERLTVRTHPATAGPDLARTARAASSGDETPDFPAAAAVDGDPATRWSSPARDGAWLRLELREPARVGRLVLRWQDAYARSYRVQTSADGRAWRTAAAVRDGRGGAETVHLDAPGTRFVRVQGVKRATRYGYSLYAVEVYAVAE
ncbi:hypothetical protein GCM10027168_52870 [Streptomyces capparidis]